MICEQCGSQFNDNLKLNQHIKVICCYRRCFCCWNFFLNFFKNCLESAQRHDKEMPILRTEIRSEVQLGPTHASSHSNQKDFYLWTLWRCVLYKRGVKTTLYNSTRTTAQGDLYDLSEGIQKFTFVTHSHSIAFWSEAICLFCMSAGLWYLFSIFSQPCVRMSNILQAFKLKSHLSRHEKSVHGQLPARKKIERLEPNDKGQFWVVVDSRQWPKHKVTPERWNGGADATRKPNVA